MINTRNTRNIVNNANNVNTQKVELTSSVAMLSKGKAVQLSIACSGEVR